MGNKLCAPWRKDYHENHPWAPKKDSHLLRLWAEIFQVQEDDGDICWGRISDDVVPVNITCIADNPDTVFQITAYNRHVEKIFDVKLIQPGVRITQASECFVHWKDSRSGVEWGLNFTTCVDARRFKDCCMLFRHGDRSPVIGYPKDTHAVTEWLSEGAQGYGQLTFRGMKQHFVLGQWFRDRYVTNQTFMDPNYNRSQLIVRSTDVERTLMSAYCNLAGFFPPDANHSWWPAGSDIHWQPIPVHTVPAELDTLLNMDAKCPMSDDLYKREQQTKAFQQKAKDNEELFTMLSKKTGRSHEDLDVLWETVDTLYCEKAHNMTLPNWTSEAWPKPNGSQTLYDWLLGLQSWEFDLKFGEPDQKARLRGGPLLKEMLSNMKQKIRNAASTKFYMYSAHDTTVMAFLHALRVSNHQQPPYAATVILELYSVNHKDYAVKVLYHNESNREPYVMHIPGCKTIENELCPYKQFVELTRSMVPGDWDKECQIPDSDRLNDGYIIGIGIGAGLVFMGIIVVIVIFIKWKKGNDPADYYRINTEASNDS